MDDLLVRNMILYNHPGNFFEVEEQHKNNNELDYNDNECDQCDALEDLLGNLVLRNFRFGYCMNTMSINMTGVVLTNDTFIHHVVTQLCGPQSWDIMLPPW